MKLVQGLGVWWLGIYLSCMHKALASISLTTTTALLRKKENMGNNVWKERAI